LKAKLGALVQDARGKLSGNVFSRNRGGSYVRQFVTPLNPGSTRQSAVRAAFTAASQAWRNLTPAERASWSTWAANHPVTDVFGDSLILAGNAAYMKINATLAAINTGNCSLAAPTFPQVTEPPGDPTTVPAASSGVAGVGSTNVITVTTATMVTSLGGYILLTTRGLSPGALPTRSMYKIAGTGLVAASGTTFTVTPKTLNPSLAFIADQTVGVRVVRFDVAGLVIDSTPYLLTAS
jgi:uncharacterized membrane protein